MDAPSDLPRRRARAAVALCRARLRRAGGGRSAMVLGSLVAAGFGVAALSMRFTDGGDAPLAGLVRHAAPWIAWLSGAPVALAAAQDRRAIDRGDGVDALAAARGVSASALESARVLAAMMQAALAIGVPIVALAALTAALAGSLPIALRRAALTAGAALFAIVAGVTIGGIAAACGRIGRERGRWLLLAIIAGPWVIGEIAGHPSWSIPGALSAALSFAMRAGGAGA